MVNSRLIKVIKNIEENKNICEPNLRWILSEMNSNGIGEYYQYIFRYLPIRLTINFEKKECDKIWKECCFLKSKKFKKNISIEWVDIHNLKENSYRYFYIPIFRVKISSKKSYIYKGNIDIELKRVLDDYSAIKINTS